MLSTCVPVLDQLDNIQRTLKSLSTKLYEGPWTTDPYNVADELEDLRRTLVRQIEIISALSKKPYK